MVGSGGLVTDAVGGEDLATTNLWYARLCRAAARTGEGALFGPLDAWQRAALIEGLVKLPRDIAIVPMRDLAWRMGVLLSEGARLSTLGLEAVAGAEFLNARLLVSDLADVPEMSRCCARLGIGCAGVRS
jgi:hypothetical protein